MKKLFNYIWSKLFKKPTDLDGRVIDPRGEIIPEYTDTPQTTEVERGRAR